MNLKANFFTFKDIHAAIIVMAAFFALMALPNISMAAQPTILLVQVTDSKHPSSYAQSLKSLYRNKFPSHKIVVVESSSRDSDKAQNQLIEGLNAHIGEENTITHLVIEAPSETGYDTSLKSHYVEIKGIGFVSEVGVNPHFEKTFSSIKDYVSPDAKIIFDTCISQCQDKSIVANFSKSVGQYFGLKNGSVFGVTLQKSLLPPLNYKVPVRREVMAFSLLAAVLTSATMTYLVVDELVLTDAITTFFGFTVPATLFALPVFTVADWFYRTVAHAKSQGIAVQFQNGVAIGSRSLSKLGNAKTIYIDGGQQTCKSVASPGLIKGVIKGLPGKFLGRLLK